jgi:hypothetical protein
MVVLDTDHVSLFEWARGVEADWLYGRCFLEIA